MFNYMYDNFMLFSVLYYVLIRILTFHSWADEKMPCVTFQCL